MFTPENSFVQFKENYFQFLFEIELNHYYSTQFIAGNTNQD